MVQDMIARRIMLKKSSGWDVNMQRTYWSCNLCQSHHTEGRAVLCRASTQTASGT